MRHILTTLIILATTSAIGQEFDPLSFFTDAEIKAANTAVNADYLTEEEKNIFLFNNLVRMQPQKFYKLYEAYCKQTTYRQELFKTDYFYTSLTNDLRNRQPAGPVLPDKKMFQLAECWADESGKKGIVGHDRITCEGGFSGENCAYGYGDGFSIVMQLLIDHGIESLGHRRNLLNPGWRGLGTAIRPHTGYRVCAVQDFTRTNDVLRAAEVERKKEEKARREEEERLLDLRSKEFERQMALWSEGERAKADVCRNLDYLSEFEKDFYFYYNLARRYPSKFNKLIWSQGPFFDRFLEAQQTELHQSQDFKRVEKKLRLSNPKPVFIPQKKYMEAGKCAVRKWRAGQNGTSCLPGPGGWRLQTFYSQSTYNDFVEILLTERDFNDLFLKNAHVVVIEDDYQAVKVFLY